MIVFGILGLYYGHKGSVKTLAIVLYCITGIFNGFYAAKFYKFMGGKHWAFNILLSAGMFPVIIFFYFLFREKKNVGDFVYRMGILKQFGLGLWIYSCSTFYNSSFYYSIMCSCLLSINCYRWAYWKDEIKRHSSFFGGEIRQDS